MVLGLTGQTGAGKSTVCRILQSEQDVCVVDADQVARQVVSCGTECLAEIALHFSIAVLNRDGTLNRKKLAELVFNDRQKLRELNQITFPHIIAAMREKIRQCQAAGYRIVILDAPVLYESKADRLCDKVLAVVADPAVRRTRIVSRDSLSEKEAKARMNSQHTDDFYTSRADYVVRNDGDMTALRLQMVELLNTLRAQN